MELSMELSAEFIRPMEERNSVPGIGAAENKMFLGKRNPFFRTYWKTPWNRCALPRKTRRIKNYLLATGQLDDAHSLPIAEAKAALSVEVLVALRNKAMESYNEIMKMSV